MESQFAVLLVASVHENVVACPSDFIARGYFYGDLCKKSELVGRRDSGCIHVDSG